MEVMGMLDWLTEPTFPEDIDEPNPLEGEE